MNNEFEQFKVRDRKAKDILNLLRITKDSFPFWPKHVPFLFTSKIIVVEFESKAIGFIAFTVKNDTAQITLTAIDKNWRGKNLGTLLMNKLFDHFQSHNISTCKSKVRTDNPKALNFYQNHGFFVEKIKIRKILGNVFLIKKNMFVPDAFNGVLDKNYAIGRIHKRSWKYRLNRRTQEIINTIKKNFPHQDNLSILDIGAADGAMLGKIKEEFPNTQCTGLEYSYELINFNKNLNIKLIQGDAQKLPLQNNCFDVIIATALIEHLERPLDLINEAYRVLKQKGIFVITTPNPFFDKLAQILSKEGKKAHQNCFNLNELKLALQNQSFTVIESRKFMISPTKIPFEFQLEKIIKFLKLNFLFLNQLIVGRK